MPSNRLKEALGSAAQDAMFHDLELNGITLRERPYTLLEMRDALRKVFGHDGTLC